MSQQESLKKSFTWILTFFLITLTVLAPQFTLAQESSLLVAQSEIDVYDPFSDYSEFDDDSEEEADINFFRNGRLFTMGIHLGSQNFTETMGRIFEPSPIFGFYVSYFFNLKIALQLSMNLSTHRINFMTQGKRVTGSSILSGYGLSLKYFIDTQNMTRGLPRFNPYLIGGLTHMSLSAKINTDTAVSNDNGFGAIIGGGIEIPIINGSAYIGFQTTYKLVTFKSIEGSALYIRDEPTGIVPRGDLLNFIGVLGINF